jgi:hypothetical protein
VDKAKEISREIHGTDENKAKTNFKSFSRLSRVLWAEKSISYPRPSAKIRG